LGRICKDAKTNRRHFALAPNFVKITRKNSDSFKNRVKCLNFHGDKKALWTQNPTTKENEAKFCSASVDYP
jgi:hypothetical protein